MICIYEKTTSDFNNNGLGTLEPIECTFKPVINGVWSLEMTLPYDAEGKSQLIANDRVLKVTDIDCILEQTAQYQLFRIYDFKKEDNFVSVIAYPIGLDARFDTFVDSVKMNYKTASQAIAQMNGLSSKYTVSGSGYDATVKSAEYANANLISILNGDNGFVQVWDGEICYDNYNIRVNHRLGSSSNPLDVRYGKNITGMSYDMDASNIITQLYPKSKDNYPLNINNRNYVNASNFADYPIPHMYYIQAPFNLVQLSDDGSEEYLTSIGVFDHIKTLTAEWLNKALSQDEIYGGLLKEIELDWINNNYDLTMIKDGVQGIVEYLWRKLIGSSHANITHGAVQSLIYNAMKAGFDDVLKNSDSDYYVGSTSKKLMDTGFGTQFYSYEWDVTGQYRVTPDGEGYVWVYASSKWNQLNTNGETTGATDKTKWKWYKVKGKTYKRYGNKKKNRYLKSQWWKINDVWYWFDSNGKSIKGSALNSMYYEYFEDAEIMLDGVQQTIYDILSDVCSNSESQLVGLLNNQMEQYCLNLFENEKLSYPTVKLDINMVDLSQTTEYKDFQSLERIHLGDSVKVFNPRLGIESTVRVIGLTYDVLRKMNTEIQIGVTETSVINLLNNIGKGSDEVRYVAGEGITIENNTISVIPPTKPYLEDVILNGESVVRNHKAYIDLDELGIDESVHVLFGTEEPTSDDGEDGDIYVKIKGVDIPYTSEITMTFATNATWTNAGITRNVDDTYNISIVGTPNQNPEYVSYKIEGLEEGKRYKFEYDYKIIKGTDYYSDITNGIVYLDEPNHYNSPSFKGDIDTAGWYEEYLIQRNDKDNNLHHYENTFTATANTMYFEFVTSSLKDNVSSEVEVSNLSVALITYEIEKVFFKYEDEWIKAGVTANPSEEATDTLTKIKINGVVYSISGSGGASSMSDLTDVELTSLTNGQILKYNSTTQKWENADESGGGSEVEITPTLSSGIKIADFEIDGVTGELYAPSGGSGGAGAGSIKTYHANWICSSSSATGTALTETLTLPKGKYLCIAHTPLTNASSAVLNQDFQFSIKVNDTIADDAYRVFNRQYGETAWVLDLSQQASVVLVSGQGASITWVSQYLDRGGMDIIPFTQLNPAIYSTEEQEIGVWVDNKPLYQKTIVCNPPIVAIAYTWTPVITLSENINVIKTEGVDIEDGEYVQFPFGGNCDANNVLSILNDAKYSREVIYVTIWYTKTADTAGSGGYNTLNAPTVHYSNSEQVIGTWTNGKPLYQKTIEQEWTTHDNSTITINGIDSTMDIKHHYLEVYYEENGSYFPIRGDAYWQYPINYFDKLYMKVIYGSATTTYKVKIILTIQYTKTTD